MPLNSGDDAPPMPISRRPCGIETFRVEGIFEDELVRARWDGRWAVVSRVLYERVALAMAVDEALAEAGMTEPFDAAYVRRSPEEFMLAVLTCCDAIDRAEFEVGGYRRVIAP